VDEVEEGRDIENTRVPLTIKTGFKKKNEKLSQTRSFVNHAKFILKGGYSFDIWVYGGVSRKQARGSGGRRVRTLGVLTKPEREVKGGEDGWGLTLPVDDLGKSSSFPNRKKTRNSAVKTMNTAGVLGQKKTNWRKGHLVRRTGKKALLETSQGWEGREPQ